MPLVYFWEYRCRTSPCIFLGTTGNIQGSVKCFNLETKKVVKRRDFTKFPMPDRVIRRVTSLGERAKQQRKKNVTLQFLNRNQDRFEWDNDDLDDIDPLVQPNTETDDVLAEIPGVVLDSDLPADSPLEVSATDERAVALAAARNAGLLAPVTAPEPTGVDDTAAEDPQNFPHNYVSDDEDEDNANNDTEHAEDSDDDVEIVGENDQNIDYNSNTVDLTVGSGDGEALGENAGTADGEEHGEANSANNDGEVDTNAAQADEINSVADESDDDSITPVVRRSRRIRKKREPTTIDFENKAWEINDGVMHINPATLDRTKSVLNVVDARKNDRIGIMAPQLAGVSEEAVSQLVNPGEAESVSDGVVQYALGVILAQQYSVNKGVGNPYGKNYNNCMISSRTCQC